MTAAILGRLFTSLLAGGAALLVPLGQSSAQMGVAGAVRFCASPPDPGGIRAQVLVDGSGSMVAFRPQMSDLVDWLYLALSHSRLQAARNCYFTSRASGGLRCSPKRLAASSFRSEGDTNLHRAIESAAGYDASLILTDGIAATGGTGSGDCSASVDPACVARSMHAAVAPQPGEPQNLVPGIWALPLVTLASGPFYAEERVAPEEFERRKAEAAANVANDTGGSAAIGKADRTADGRLTFQYTGPRQLLILVFARNLTLGRSVVRSLVEQAPFAQVARVASLKEFVKGTAFLTPFEVYPGYREPVAWKNVDINRPGGRPDVKGTVTRTWEPPGRLKLSCPKGNNEAVFVLTRGATPAEGACLDLFSLPQLSEGVDVQPPSVALLKGHQSDARTGNLLATLTCDGSRPLPCAPVPHRVVWTAKAQWPGTAACVGDGGCRATAVQRLRNMSTTTPSLFPHRIYGLQQMVEIFYRGLGRQGPTVPFASLEICTVP
jgi:hypothetical protein